MSQSDQTEIEVLRHRFDAVEQRVTWLQVILGVLLGLVVLAAVPLLAAVAVFGLYFLLISLAVVLFIRLVMLLLDRMFGGDHTAP